MRQLYKQNEIKILFYNKMTNYYRTISSYDAYNMNIRRMHASNTPYFMGSSDHGNGPSMPIFSKPESIPKKVKKKLVKPGDKVAQIQSQIKLSNTQKIYGKLLSINDDE